jgi:hypothetical protein
MASEDFAWSLSLKYPSAIHRRKRDEPGDAMPVQVLNEPPYPSLVPGFGPFVTG